MHPAALFAALPLFSNIPLFRRMPPTGASFSRPTFIASSVWPVASLATVLYYYYHLHFPYTSIVITLGAISCATLYQGQAIRVAAAGRRLRLLVTRAGHPTSTGPFPNDTWCQVRKGIACNAMERVDGQHAHRNITFILNDVK